uniref:Uncharacterized protein n=1 Tax=Arundo donax TaxID=35708 RepID=A0A0A9AWE6_ARUDO
MNGSTSALNSGRLHAVTIRIRFRCRIRFSTWHSRLKLLVEFPDCSCSTFTATMVPSRSVPRYTLP